MLVPVQGGVQELQKRNRSYPLQRASLARVPIPKIYIFNLGPDPWKGVGGGKEWTIPGCPKGALYSDPVEVPMLYISEYDLADGGNNMGVVNDSGLSEAVEVGEETRQMSGVVDDIIGLNSGSPSCSLNTTSGKWHGVFFSLTPVPSDEDIELAQECRRQYMNLIYSEGTQRIEQKMAEAKDPVLRMKERKLFNGAAAELGFPPLYGEGQLRLAHCPECKEQIADGATYCKHCSQAIDPASVEARAKKRAKAAAKMAEETGEVGE